MMRRIWQLAPWPVLAGLFLGIAYLLISTTFMFYDDEGYVLHSLRNYLGGGRLYDEIFSQYGPWPYVYHQLVTAITGEPLTHLLGRGLTALHWSGSALLCGAIAFQLTRSTPAALAASASAFGLLWQMSAEPTHPGSLISLLVAMAVYAAVRLSAPDRPTLAAGVIGVVAALLFLTKINVGLLLLAGAGCAALRFTAWPETWRRPAAMLAGFGLMLVPWLLMSRKLDDSWVLIFAVQFTLGTAALLWVTPAAVTGRPLRPSIWLGSAGAGIFSAILICAIVCWRGTSPAALAQAVLFSPLNHPTSFMFGFTWVPAVWPVSIAAWLLATRAGWELRRQGGVTVPTARIVATARLAALAVFLWNAQTWLTIFGVGRFIVVCLPLLPLFVVPLIPAPGKEPARFASVWLAAFIALPQVLHAFPVAGSQMGWGTFALVPLFVTGLHEAWGVIGCIMPRAGRGVAIVGWTILLAANSWQVWLLGSNGWDRYRTSQPLRLPGAEDVRVDGPARQTLRLLTLNATVHADLLFSRPGMFSYNIWSGVPTPTAQNATHWFWLLDTAAQQRIIERLRTTPRSAIIVNHRLDEFLVKIDVSMQGPLQSYITEHYQPLFQAGFNPPLGVSDFTFLVPAGSRAVPFGKVVARTKSEPEADGRQPVLLQANLALNGCPASVRLSGASFPWRLLQDYTAQGARIYLEPINTAGDAHGAAILLPASGTLRGLFRLTVFAADNPRPQRPHDVVLAVVDPDGRILAEAVF